MSKLKNYKCDICKDKQMIFTGENSVKFCECRQREIEAKRFSRSDISDLFKDCNFSNFEIKTDAQAKVKNSAVNFFKQTVSKDIQEKAKCIIFCGQVGSGKTHLAVSILNNFMKWNYDSLYTNYKDLVRTLSQNAMDKEKYSEYIGRCVSVDVLLIDDLFKCRSKAEITTAQLNYIYEIVNARYINKKITVITTEKSIQQLLDIDEAITSRLIEMTKKEFIADMKGISNHRIT